MNNSGVKKSVSWQVRYKYSFLFSLMLESPFHDFFHIYLYKEAVTFKLKMPPHINVFNVACMTCYEFSYKEMKLTDFTEAEINVKYKIIGI